MKSIQELGNRAVKSIIALTSRTFILNALNFAGAFALTIFLSPGDFGVFIVTSAVVDILAYFSDVGLAGALVQKKEKLSKEEVYSTFTIQMGLVSIGILIALAFSRPIIAFYKLDGVGLVLFYSLLASFFFSSLKTIPTVLSERKLKFERVIIPQIVETVFFNVIIVLLAWKGFGLRSYIYAVLARAISGTLTIYLLVPWRPKILLRREAVKGLLGFGIPYQMNSLVAVFKDRVSLLILGRVIGLEGVGILGWAEKWSNLPLRYFLDTTIRVAFPLFSRLQDDLTKAKKALEQSVYFICTFVFPLLAGGFFIMPTITELIPKYSKWQPGLSAFNLFLISAAIASVSTFLTNFLTALGKVKYVLKLMVMWTVLTLTLYPLFAYYYGFNGVALASVIISTTSFIPYLLVRKVVAVNLFRQIYPAFLSSLAMILGLSLIRDILPQNVSGMIYTVISGIIIYVVCLVIVDRRQLINQVSTFVAYVKKT
jgi:O-antigen/teichoic acid export membrane protein